MADFDPAQDAGQDDSNQARGAAPFSTALNLLGAMASVGLLAGVGIWGYKLVMRDVSGVPVVRAIEGPMRVQPDNPGGRPADHQGLAVNAVAAKGAAEPTADRLALAPRPVELLAEDKPLPKLKDAQEKKKAQKKVVNDAEPIEEEPVDAIKTGTVQSLVNQLIAEVMPEGEAVEGPKVIKAAVRVQGPVQPGADAPIIQSTEAAPAAPAEEPELALASAVISGPGLARSIRPLVRPDRPTQAALVQGSPRVRDVDPDSLPAGTRLAQLGAFESADVARQEWDRLTGRFGDYLDGKSRVIQKTTSGGRTFYRLRAHGFEDLADARRFCSALVAEKADCIPVTTR